jgi:hypothetical protein
MGVVQNQTKKQVGLVVSNVDNAKLIDDLSS